MEHKHQPIIPLFQFIMRIVRYGGYALLLLLLSLSIGIIGYHNVANLSWIDSFYMTSMILTGMGPTLEMTTREAKLFSSFFALYSGIAFLSIATILFTPIVHRIMHILHIDFKEK